MEPVIIIQARCGSSRLPNKVLAELGTSTVLEYVVRRCQTSRRARGVLVATTTDDRDDRVVALSKRLGVGVFRGSETDVLSRFVGAADAVGAQLIVRVTADCPLIDPWVIDDCIALYQASYPRYIYTHIPGYPNGIGDSETVDVPTLRRVLDATELPRDAYFREHVTPYIYRQLDPSRWKFGAAPAELHRPELRVTVDEAADLEAVRAICNHFAPRIDMSAREIIAFLDEHPEVVALNRHVKQRT